MNEKLKTAYLVVRLVLISFVSVVLGFALYQWNAQSLTGNVMPMPFGVGVGVVMSGSMEPDLSIDDVVIVVEQDEYEVGDVVVFQLKNELIVHEIIRFEGENEVVTKGSANPSEDDPISIHALKGKVVQVFEGVGGLVKWIKSLEGTIIILALSGGLLVASYAVERNTKDEKDDKIEEIRKQIEALKAFEMEKNAGVNNLGANNLGANNLGANDLGVNNLGAGSDEAGVSENLGADKVVKTVDENTTTD